MMSRSQRIINLLERYFQTDIRYVLAGGFWTALGYTFQVGLGLVSTIILANFLEKDLLGTYQFVLAMAGVLGVLTLSGMGTAITRAVAQGHEYAFRSGVLTKLRWSIGVFASALIVAGYYFLQGDPNLALAFLFVATTTPLTESFILYESYLHGKQSFKDTVILGFWRKPIPLIALIITLYFTTKVSILIGIYLGFTLLSTLIVYRLVIKKYQPPIAIHQETIKYSKQLSLMNILGRVAEHSDKILLWYLLGPVSVALFALAQLVSKYSGGLVSVAVHIALPKISQRDLLTLQRTLPRKVWLFTTALIPFVILYIILIPVVFTIILPDYPESIILAQVLGITIFFIPHSLYGQVLFAHRQTRALYTISIVVPLLKIFFIGSLILVFGLWGAVYGLILGEFILAFLLWLFFKIAREDQ